MPYVDGDAATFVVSCRAEAGALDEEVPYAIALTLEAPVAVDVPIYGGTRQGGIALRLAARLMVTPSVALDKNAVFEPAAAGQLFAGLAYYP